MIIILDDTFPERYKHNEVTFLNADPYRENCRVFSMLKNNEINEAIISILSNCHLLCYHKTIQIYNRHELPIDTSTNEDIRNSLLNEFTLRNIPKIQFSYGNTISDINTLAINKNLFYSNLKYFLDHYIETATIEYRLLFYGKNYKKIEFDELCMKLSLQVRLAKTHEELLKPSIVDEMRIVFGTETDEILLRIKSRSISSDDLITLINKTNIKIKSRI